MKSAFITYKEIFKKRFIIISLFVLAILLIIFFSLLLNGKAISYNQLLFRNKLAYEINSDKPFSGKVKYFDSSIDTYLDGKKVKSIQYWNDGELRREFYLDQDGTNLKRYSEKGVLIEEEHKDYFGKRNGYYQLNSDNNQPLIEANYNHGILDGDYKEWYDNGQKKYEIKFSNGLKDGVEKKWSENGEYHEKFYNPKKFYSIAFWKNIENRTVHTRHIALPSNLFSNLVSLYHKNTKDAIAVLGAPDSVNTKIISLLELLDDLYTPQNEWLYFDNVYDYNNNFLYYEFDGEFSSRQSYYIFLYFDEKKYIQYIGIVLLDSDDNFSLKHCTQKMTEQLGFNPSLLNLHYKNELKYTITPKDKITEYSGFMWHRVTVLIQGY